MVLGELGQASRLVDGIADDRVPVAALGANVPGDDADRRRQVGRLFTQAQKLGLLVALGDERYEAPSPALLQAAEDVLKMGIALPAALATIEKLNRNSHSAARTFVNLFLEELWKPFDEAGRPDDGWPEIIGAIERLRPLAVDALIATFRMILTEEVEKAFGEVLERRKKK